MPAGYTERLKGLLAKIESTYKTDSSPAAGTDGIQIEENIWSQIEIGYLEDNLRDNIAGTSMGTSGGSTKGGRYGHVTATVAVKGCTSAFSSSNVPELDVLMRIAGFDVTVDETPSSETVTYAPVSTGFESATVYAYSSGSLYKLVGCQAYLTEFTLVASQIMRMTFDIWGVMNADPTDVALPAITYAQAALNPTNVAGAGVTFAAYSIDDFQSAVIEGRQTIATLPRGNDADGHAGYVITDRDPHMRFMMDKTALSSFNPYNYEKTGTTFAVSIGSIGSTQYNKVDVDAAQARVMEVGHAATDGLAMWDLLVRLQNSSSGDDDLTIVFS